MQDLFEVKENKYNFEEVYYWTNPKFVQKDMESKL